MTAFSRHAGRRSGLLSALALSATLLSACTSVEVDPEVGASEQLPRPDRVLVYNFAVTPQEVQLDAVGSAITSTFDGTADSEAVRLGDKIADELQSLFVEQGWIAGS